eukprot:3934017-Rhodomonas_salina.2
MDRRVQRFKEALGLFSYSPVADQHFKRLRDQYQGQIDVSQCIIDNAQRLSQEHQVDFHKDKINMLRKKMEESYDEQEKVWQMIYHVIQEVYNEGVPQSDSRQ